MYEETEQVKTETDLTWRSRPPVVSSAAGTSPFPKKSSQDNSHQLETACDGKDANVRGCTAFSANDLMKHKKRLRAWLWNRHLHNVCLQLGCYAAMALQEGQAVLLEVALKNVLPFEAKGQHLYPLFPRKSAAWGDTAQVILPWASREGAGGTQHLPRHIPAWNEWDHPARVS